MDAGPNSGSIRQAATFKLTPGLGIVALAWGIAVPAKAIQLGDIPADNEVQNKTGVYIDDICPQMAGMADKLSDPQLRLLNRCGGAKFDQEREGFGLGDGNGVLQRLAPEETLTIGSAQTDTALKDHLQTRFSAIRAGITGATISGVQWMDNGETGGTAGSDDFSRWGFFLNGLYATGDKDADKNENEFDYDAYGLTTGLDYRFSDQLVLGIAYSYVDADADVDDELGAVSSGISNAGKGDQNSESDTLAIYGTWYQEDWYFDGSVAYSWVDVDGERSIQYGNVNQTAKMETDADQVSASLGGGYNHHLGGAWNARYFLRLDYADIEIDGYRETPKERTAEGANPMNPSTDKDSLMMAVDDQDIDSLQSVLGVNVTYVANTDFGVVTPYLTGRWHHEFEDDERTITAKYVFDPTNDVLRFGSNPLDEDFFGLSAGVNSVLKGGTQIFANYDTALGLEDVTIHVFTVGLRKEF